MTDTLKPCPYPAGAVENLTNHQQQADMDGARVTVSRQALDEVLSFIAAWQTRPTPPAWPENARFQYGDAVRVIVKREGQPRFPGYIIGWYQPMDGRHTGWVLEHERDGIIHVYPDAAVEESKP